MKFLILIGSFFFGLSACLAQEEVADTAAAQVVKAAAPEVRAAGGDGSQLAAWVEKLGLVYKPARRFSDLPDMGPFVTEKKEVTCYPSGCMHRVYDKRDDILVRFNFGEITKEAGEKIRAFMPDFDENKNYLGNDSCRAQRESGWLDLLTLKEVKRINADSAFCFQVPAADFEPYDGKYAGRIVVVLHKKDRGDITVEYFYRVARQRRVKRWIRKMGEMVRYR